MSTKQQTVFVRIVELSQIRMARSGRADLDAFNQWWSAVAVQDKSSLFPRDFMWYNPELNGLEWLYALPAGVEDTGGYEVFDFLGGLYAVAACKDEDAEIERTEKLIRQWVAQSGIFEESSAWGPTPNDTRVRYGMGHVITPRNAKEIMGYHQMDLFVPIVPRQHRPG